MINIDLNKAKDIWKNIIRIKNALRNAPNDIRIERANSISELETINNPQNLIDMYSSPTH